MAGRILNFGSLNIDYVYVVDHIVREGETESSLDYQLFAGGKGLNQSIALARAGGQVFHAGKIGKEGLFLKETLEREGINSTYLSVDPGANGHAIIQRSRKGENAIVLYPGANHKITKEDVDTVLAGFEAGDVLVCQNEISSMEYLLDKAYRKGLNIAWNPSPVTSLVEQIDISHITWLVINEIEGRSITKKADPKEILQVLGNRYPKLFVVLTLGKDGAIYQGNGQQIWQESFSVPVVDTTAAGDTFFGYLMSQLAGKGQEEGHVKEGLKLAAAAAALAVSKEGAVPSIPRVEEVRKFMDQLTDNRIL